MKHIFVINPHAGGENHAESLAKEIEALAVDSEIYQTTGHLDATRYVDQYCRAHPGQAVRFYACGGDGTLNEVASGALPHPEAEVGCHPCGSGNDYVKYWPTADFRSLQALVEAPAVPVDLMRVRFDGQERHCVNLMNLGFEAAVCRSMEIVRGKPLVGGKMAYTSGIVHSLTYGRHHPCRISVDSDAWHEGDMLLGSLANGRFAGGGYCCAPRSVNDDGLLEVMAVRPISVARFVSVIDLYKKGQHLDSPKMKDVVEYRRGRRVSIESDKPLWAALDGELVCSKRFDIDNLPQAIRFAVPQK